MAVRILAKRVNITAIVKTYEDRTMGTGIQETKEVIAFITTLGVLVGREAVSDGLQLTDALKLFDNKDFREKVSIALDGLTLVPAELKDLSISEGFDLSLAALESFREILSAFEQRAA